MNINVKIQLNSLFFLLFLNTCLFIVATLAQAYAGRFDTDAFVAFGGLGVYEVIYGGKLWLLLTSNFFHLNIIHFALNMYALLRIGELVNVYYGGRKLFATYVIGGVVGAIVTVLVSYFYLKVFDSPLVFSLGASGSIFALLGLLVGGSLRRSRYEIDFPFSFSDLLPVLMVSLMFSFIPGINLWAHVGGLMGGTVLGFIFKSDYSQVRGAKDHLIESILYRVSQGIIVISYIFLVLNFFY